METPYSFANTVTFFPGRALTTHARPTTQRAAPFHSLPRTLSTCSSSESQHMTALQKGPLLVGWLGIQSLDTSFVNSVHFKHWLEASEIGHGEDIGGERRSRWLGVEEYGLLITIGMEKQKYCK